jgi:hypothetical protein
MEKSKAKNAFDSNALVVSTLEMVGDMMDVMNKLKLMLLQKNKANQGIL